MKKLLLSILSAFAALAATAQTSIQVQTHNVVDLNEQFNVTFIVEGENSASDFEWECPEGFDLVWGPQKSSSSSISIINGKRTSSRQSSFTYILMPKSTGEFELPPATAKVKGNVIVSRPVTVKVVQQDSAPQSQSGSGNGGSVPSDPSASSGRGQGGGQPSGREQSASGGEIFLNLSLDRTEAVVGQPINATLKIYQRASLSGFENASFPSFSGFWSQEVEAPTNIEFTRETFDGKIYDAAVLRRYVLIPQQTGKLTIEPAELVCLVNVRVQSRTGSIFDGFFDDYTTVRKKVSSKAVTVNVSPLPSGAPASFGGGVGKFSISAKLAKDRLRAHEANSLIVTVSGRGNVSLLETPEVKFPLDMEVYDVKVTDRSAKGSLSGSKEFEFPFIPRSPGEFTIEPVQYAYYDADARKYVTLNTAPLTFTVEKGADVPAGGAVVAPVQQNGVRSLGQDIRFISTRPVRLPEKGSFFVGSALFAALCLAVLLAAALCWFIFRRAAARRADVVGSRNRKATRKALKQLRTASTFLKQNLYTAFYEELHKALLGFISDKLNIPMSELNKENISAKLAEGGVPEDTVTAFVGLVDDCEFARYSPSAGNEAMQSHYDMAAELISTIDSSMKSGKRTPSGAAVLAALLMLAPLAANAQQASGNEAPAAVAEQPAAPAAEQSTAPSADYPQQLWERANAAYSEGRWDDAADAYGLIVSLGLESPKLYYNLGNACFKAGSLGKAIVNYERALKLDPSDADVRYNLEFAASRTQDRIDSVPEFFLRTWTRRLCYLLDSDAWAAIFIAFLVLACAMALLFLLAPTSGWKRTGFISALVCIVLGASAIGFSVHQKNEYFLHDEAVVMKPVISAKSSPDGNMDLFILHEGTKVKIIDTVGGWMNVEISDGRQGWTKAGDLEII